MTAPVGAVGVQKVAASHTAQWLSPSWSTSSEAIAFELRCTVSGACSCKLGGVDFAPVFVKPAYGLSLLIGCIVTPVILLKLTYRTKGRAFEYLYGF